MFVFKSKAAATESHISYTQRLPKVVDDISCVQLKDEQRLFL